MNSKSLIILFKGYNKKFSKYNPKFEYIKKRYPAETFDRIMFDSSFEGFRNRLQEIENTFSRYSRVEIIGLSMGCISALYLHFKYGFRTVLINPSYFPEITLKDDLIPEHRDEILALKNEIDLLPKEKSINLFIAEDDERLEHSRFINHFRDNIRLIVRTPNGGHRYSVFEEQFERMQDLLTDWSDVDIEDIGEIWQDFDNDFSDDAIIEKF